MSEDRRYTQSEIASIFEKATETQEAARRKISDNEGLTLVELQQIGHEAGISSESIARAAAAIGKTDTTSRPRTYLGLPVTAARTIQLPGHLSEGDWEMLVGDLRETFQVSGEIVQHGSFREWTNWNLHVHVEPTESGHRLRFHTTNENLRLGLSGGLLFLGLGLMFMLMLALKGDFMIELDKTLFVSMFAVLGLGGASIAAYRLPRWARERESQMDEIVTRVIDRMEAEPMASSLKESQSDAGLIHEQSHEADETVRPQQPSKTRS
jgi:hypothetical protein